MTGLFLKILGMSLTSCIVIVAVMLLRAGLKRAPKVFSYILWWAALFRLLCPVSFELPRAPVAPVSVEMAAFGTYEETEERFSPPVRFEGGSGETTLYVYETAPPQQEKIPPRPADIAAYIWLAGVLAMIIYGGTSYIRLKIRLKGSVEMKTEKGVYISDRTDNAFIMGVFFPKIYIPAAVSTRDRELILMHERGHIKRLDPPAKLIMFTALCIHWFNPLVWVMFRLFEHDMEMSCDERVTAPLDNEGRADYSQALLNISSKRAAPFSACFGESGTKQRVINVLNFKKPAVLLTVICGAIIAAAAVILTANKAHAEENALSGFFPHNTTLILTKTTAYEYGENSPRTGTLPAENARELIRLISSVPLEEREPEGVQGADCYGLSYFHEGEIAWISLVTFVNRVDSTEGYLLTEGAKYRIPKKEYEKIAAEWEHTLDECIKYPPMLSIPDNLSSQFNSGIQTAAVGCEWSYEGGGYEKCAVSPLDPSLQEDGIIKKSSFYSGYTFPCFYGEQPDRISLKGYDPQYTGKTEAREKLIYGPRDDGRIYLESNTVYALTAFWDGEKEGERGFSGNAVYYFSTGDMPNEKREKQAPIMASLDPDNLTFVYAENGDGSCVIDDREKISPIVEAMSSAHYTRLSAIPPVSLGKSPAVSISLYAGYYNYSSYSIWSEGGRYYLNIDTTNSIHVYEMNGEDFERIVSECEKYIEKGHFAVPAHEISDGEEPFVPEEITLLPVTEQWEKNVSFGTVYPRILYGDREYCIFTEGRDSLFVYSFDKKEITFSANIRESINAGMDGFSCPYYSTGVTVCGESSLPLISGGDTVGFICTVSRLSDKFRETYIWDPISEKLLHYKGDTPVFPKGRHDFADPETLDTYYFSDNISVSLTLKGYSDTRSLPDNLSGESCLSLITLKRNVNGMEENFYPFPE